MEKAFEPMLAATLLDVATLPAAPYWLISVKLDGYRAIVRDGVLLSRNLKPIRNAFIQAALGRAKYNGLDGELIVGPPNGDLVFNKTSSGVSAQAGEPDFTFWVFDDFRVYAHPFQYRIGHVEDRVESYGVEHIKHVPHQRVRGAEIQDYEAQALDQGFEGVMLRHPMGHYKFGRATPKEGTLWKLKRFIDGEALVTELLEGAHNQNRAEADELGRTKRSSAKAGKVPAGVVGTILGKDLKTGKPLRISPGTMTAEERALYWREPARVLHKVCRYKAFDYGIKDAVRFPTWSGLRALDDVPRPGV